MGKTPWLPVGLIVLAVLALVLQGGMPHRIDVGGGETVTAYHNGIVLTGAKETEGLLSSWGKRTLQAKEDGTIVSTSTHMIGGATGAAGYVYISHPATPEEIHKWRIAQEALRAKN